VSDSEEIVCLPSHAKGDIIGEALSIMGDRTAKEIVSDIWERTFPRASGDGLTDDASTIQASINRDKGMVIAGAHDGHEFIRMPKEQEE